MRLAWALVAALFAAIGCGGGAAPGAAAAAPAQDAGTPSPDAGTAPDAGPAPDAGAAPPDAGPPDAGPDAGIDGGASGCAALVPQGAGDPVIVDLDLGDPSQSCSAARPDQGGAVPLRIATYDSAGLHSTAWAFYRASEGALLSRREWASGLGPVSFLAQPDGFTGIGFAGDASQESLDLYILGHDGAELSIAHTPAFLGDGDPVGDPSGGTVLFSVHRDKVAWLLQFERYDAEGDRTARGVDGAGGPLPADVRWVAGVSTSGDTLVVFGPMSGAPCRAVWLDHDGARVSGDFAPPTCRIHRFYPLLDGRLAVETESLDASHSISAAVAPRATAFEASPAFLDGLSVRELFTLPGGKGYAVREQGAGERFRLFLPGGDSCGDLPAPALDRGPVQIGRDGTLVEQDLTGAGCRFRWYPGLFK